MGVDELREARQSRSLLQQASLLRGIAAQELLHLRAWPDHTQLSAQDVPQLRQLVDLPAAEHPPQPGDSLIALDRYQRSTPAVVHGPEFVEPKWMTASSDPSLAIQDGTARRTLDGDRDKSQR